jgi:hypothetical protein
VQDVARPTQQASLVCRLRREVHTDSESNPTLDPAAQIGARDRDAPQLPECMEEAAMNFASLPPTVLTKLLALDHL